MALTGLLKNNSKMKELIKSTAPVKFDFVSNTSFAPFSTKNPMLAPYILENPTQSKVVGTAADYLFRFMTARAINNNKSGALENMVASHAIDRLKKREKFRDQYNVINEKFNKYIAVVRSYIYGVDCFDLAVDAAIYFAKLDVLYRVGVIKKYVDDILERPDECVYNDIVNVANLFKNLSLKADS